MRLDLLDFGYLNSTNPGGSEEINPIEKRQNHKNQQADPSQNISLDINGGTNT